MTRQLTGHIVNPANDQLKITVADEPGSGGANHRYEITGLDTEGNASKTGPDGYSHRYSKLVVLFQNGPIPEHGVNGVTHEALLAILIDRMEGFQRGPFASPYNAQALHHLRTAQEVLLARTRERMARGVEGKLEK